MRTMPDYLVTLFYREHTRLVMDFAHRCTLSGKLPFKPVNLGDGNLLIFDHPNEALTFALCIASSWRRYWKESIAPGLPDSSSLLKMRIGVHFGRVNHDDLKGYASGVSYSEAINTTYVLQQQAKTDQVVVTETLLSLVTTTLYRAGYRGRFDPLLREEDAPEEEQLSYYECFGLKKPPLYGPGIVRNLSASLRKQIGLDWHWRGLYLESNPATAEESLASFEQAILYDPTIGGSWANQAVHLLRNGKAAKAVEVLEEGLKHAPRDLFILNNLAVVYERTRQYDKALDCCNLAIEINPDYDYAYFNLSKIYLELDRLPESEKCLRRTIELNPILYKAVYNLACVLTLQGRHDEALEQLAKAIDIYPAYCKFAVKDEDLAPLKDHERFIELTGGAACGK